jgi:hypothetical protein
MNALTDGAGADTGATARSMPGPWHRSAWPGDRCGQVSCTIGMIGSPELVRGAAVLAVEDGIDNVSPSSADHIRRHEEGRFKPARPHRPGDLLTCR